jgi:hypothetical protein
MPRRVQLYGAENPGTQIKRPEREWASEIRNTLSLRVLRNERSVRLHQMAPSNSRLREKRAVRVIVRRAQGGLSETTVQLM